MHKTIANCDICGGDISNYYDVLYFKRKDELSREYDKRVVELCSMCGNFFEKLLVSFLVKNEDDRKEILNNLGYKK